MNYTHTPCWVRTTSEISLILFGEHDSTTTIGNFMNKRFALFADFRSTPDNNLHRSGRPLHRLSDGITLLITKKPVGTADIRCYVYILSDAHLNILGALS